MKQSQLGTVLFAENHRIKQVHLNVPYFDEGMKGLITPTVIAPVSMLPYVLVSIADIGENIDVEIKLRDHSPHQGSDLLALWRTMQIVCALEDITAETLECALIAGISFPKDDVPDNLRDFTSVVTDQIGTDRYFQIMREQSPSASDLERAVLVAQDIGVPVALEPICELVSLGLLWPTEDLERVGVSTLERLLQRRERCQGIIGKRFQPMISRLIHAWNLQADSPLIGFLCKQIIAVLLSGISSDEVAFGCALIMSVDVIARIAIHQVPLPGELPDGIVRAAQVEMLRQHRKAAFAFMADYFNHSVREEYELQIMEIAQRISRATPDHRNLDII